MPEQPPEKPRRRRDLVRENRLFWQRRQKLTTPDFGLGTAALMRMVADYLHRKALPVADMGEWDHRLVYMLVAGVLLRGRFPEPREPQGLELALELARLKPARRLEHLLDPVALAELSPRRAEELLRRLFAELTAGLPGDRPWMAWQPVAGIRVPVGTRVRIRKWGADRRGLPHQGRRGTIMAELDPATIETPGSWKTRWPEHVYLVHLPRQRGTDQRLAMAGPVEVPYADYELEVETVDGPPGAAEGR